MQFPSQSPLCGLCIPGGAIFLPPVVIDVTARLAGVMKIGAMGGMNNPQSSWSFDHSSASSILEHALSVVEMARPLVETISRKDRDLASQLRRAISSVVLNLAEGFGTAQGNSRLRFETAREQNESGLGLPKYVEQEFREYLRCGIPCHR
jgi:hypothetical protein